jgi:hypothetical protein
MYFIVSKTLLFFTLPSNLLILLAIAGTVMLFTKCVRTGRALLLVSMLAIVVFGLSPLSRVIFHVLESRFRLEMRAAARRPASLFSAVPSIRTFLRLAKTSRSPMPPSASPW